MAPNRNALKRKLNDSVAQASTSCNGISIRIGHPIALQGLVYRDIYMDVPLDHSSTDASKETLYIHAREVTTPVKAQSSPSMPRLCFFQGGPGFESPAPNDHILWLSAAVKHFKVVLLDQRGTGLSTPIRASSLVARGETSDQLAHLKHFRADSIIADAELLRKALTKDEDRKRWSILGQSFGGFCCVEYLSRAPEGLYEVFITGGIPPGIGMPCAARLVYESTFERVKVQNEKYYKRFPGDVEIAKDIVNHLMARPEGGVQTPRGSWLRPRTFQLLGMACLGSGGGFERLHFMLASAFTDPEQTELSPTFLDAFDRVVPFDSNPLYALLHEACYSCGAATNWAAERVRQEKYAKEFDAEVAAATKDSSCKVYFTGEMIFPWMYEDLVGLRQYSEVAHSVAAYDQWTQLYDLKVLEKNSVPVAAATFIEDMYVDFKLAQDTACKIAGMRQWMTNEYMHSGIRDDGAVILEKLLGYTRGVTALF